MANSAETVSDRYELRRKIAAGPISTVYEGWDSAIRRRVAVKEVPLTDNGWEHLTRFRREAQAAGRLQHPHIVGIFDYYETSNCAYIVMEYVEGATLKALLDKEKRMPLSAVVRLMEDVLAGLQYSHDQGVVHRDLKPSNIMITREGRAKIADFGIARLEDSSITQIGAVMGTPAYMSPEQFCGQAIEASTDIYSAGVILYELLTGARPFDGGIATIMHKALNTAPPKPSDVSDAVPRLVDSVVLRAMAKRPQQRFGSASEFAQALRQALAARKDEALAQPKVAKGARPTLLRETPSRAKYAVAAILVLVAALGAGAAYWRLARHEPAAKQIAQPSTPATPTAIGTASAPAEASGSRHDIGTAAGAAPAEQRHGPDLSEAPAPAASAASDQPSAVLPTPLPQSVPQLPPPIAADADLGIGLKAPLPPPASLGPIPSPGSVATLDAGPKEWDNALRPLPPRRIEPLAPAAPRVPLRRTPPLSPGPRAPAEGTAPSAPAPPRPADRDTGNAGESSKPAAKPAPAPREQESAPPPPRSFGRYEVRDGKRIFVPAPPADIAPQPEVGPANPPPVPPGRSERPAAEDHRPNGEAALGGPVPGATPDGKARTPPNADGDGSAAPPKSFGRYEILDGRRVYIPAE
ncbi:MAG: protein kinase [Acetobacteraceae bacterium]|nr:protein kinase [Acetobacteraceae bacterium]